MASNPYKNKVVYGGQTLIDLTEDTVTADTLLAGYTAHNAAGEAIVGTLELMKPLVLVWTNSSPSSGMGATDISLPSGTSETYSRLLVEFVSTGYNPWLYTSALVCIGTESFATGNITSTASLYAAYRSVVYKTGDVLSVNAGYRLRVNANSFNGETVNTILVPLNVYGIPDDNWAGTA